MELLAQCHENGFPVGLDLQSVIRLLESENSKHGFRYFVFEGTIRPEINYLREVIDELIRVIEQEVNKSPTQGLTRGVIKFTVYKPEKK